MTALIQKDFPALNNKTMNFKTLALAALSIIGLVSAEEQDRHYPENQAICTRELEEIVYQPESPALNYFNRITEEIKIAGPILWTPQNVSFIQSFEAKYRVAVQVYDAFYKMIYPTDGSSTPVGFLPITSTANMNGSGLLRDTDEMALLRYEFIVFDCIGQMKYILINMPLDESPAFKN